MFDLQNQVSSSNNTIHLTGKLSKKKCFWLTFNLRANLILTFLEYSREYSKIKGISILIIYGYLEFSFLRNILKSSSPFEHLEKFNLNISSLSFGIRVTSNLLHP